METYHLAPSADTLAPVYLRASGSCLPGPPISNDEMEDYLGTVHGQRSRARALALRQNGIRTRHYALAPGGRPTHSGADLASAAVRDAFAGQRALRIADTDYLAVAGSFGDRMLPGLASPVQHSLGLDGIEIASFQSVCGSAAMALQSAYLQVRCGARRQAVVVGAEFVSRILRGSWIEPTPYAEPGRGVDDLGVEFLRWTLSDGAGAAVFSPVPLDGAPALRLDWVDVTSYAGRFEVCMQLGAADDSWASYTTPIEAAHAGAFCLRQDFRSLRRMFPVWVERLRQLGETRGFAPEDIDAYLCHFSSYALGREVMALMREARFMIPEERWYSNLRERGNTGAASIFVMLDEFLRSRPLRRGQRLLLCIPESGWGMVAYSQFTVV
jgi:3-oxoacyl-[acyl-carrier-protein] synthase-3